MIWRKCLQNKIELINEKNTTIYQLTFYTGKLKKEGLSPERVAYLQEIISANMKYLVYIERLIKGEE